MAVFKAFKPEAMNKIAKAMGYTGDMGQFQSYIEQDPARQARMQVSYRLHSAWLKVVW